MLYVYWSNSSRGDLRPRLLNLLSVSVGKKGKEDWKLQTQPWRVLWSAQKYYPEHDRNLIGSNSVIAKKGEAETYKPTLSLDLSPQLQCVVCFYHVFLPPQSQPLLGFDSTCSRQCMKTGSPLFLSHAQGSFAHGRAHVCMYLYKAEKTYRSCRYGHHRFTVFTWIPPCFLQEMEELCLLFCLQNCQSLRGSLGCSLAWLAAFGVWNATTGKPGVKWIYRVLLNGVLL